ncbi:VOC family protein [Paenibacillus piscarius]|uniref:VOC family protein n=1 Tax=Paenibacillus piscarius TaxID=1089681 RepID=UPI001EE831D5|nr:VOC family protein [Paenibacillus piscarius]
MIHHIEINVSNLRRSAEFWGWFLSELGYTQYQQWEEGNSWKSGNAYLVLVQTKEKYVDVSYHRSQIGLNHLAFHANSREQVDELTTMVRDKGMHILYEDRHPFAGGDHYYALFFEDPDRIKVEVVAP